MKQSENKMTIFVIEKKMAVLKLIVKYRGKNMGVLYLIVNIRNENIKCFPKQNEPLSIKQINNFKPFCIAHIYTTV
jgi:hypothetical protein